MAHKTVTIHQPTYLPYVGFFNKIKKSDIFILFDTAQYVKNQFINRNKIKSKNGSVWLTIPIENNKSYLKPIKDVLLPKNEKWKEKHWKSILQNYSQTEYFEKHKTYFEKIYNKKWTKLVDINTEIIDYLMGEFNLNKKTLFASEILSKNKKNATDILIELVENVDGNKYLSGPSGKQYLELSKFKDAGIEVEFQQFEHPIYKQKYNGFETNMAAIDLLFNEGQNSKNIL